MSGCYLLDHRTVLQRLDEATGDIGDCQAARDLARVPQEQRRPIRHLKLFLKSVDVVTVANSKIGGSELWAIRPIKVDSGPMNGATLAESLGLPCV